MNNPNAHSCVRCHEVNIKKISHEFQDIEFESTRDIHTEYRYPYNSVAAKAKDCAFFRWAKDGRDSPRDATEKLVEPDALDEMRFAINKRTDSLTVRWYSKDAKPLYSADKHLWMFTDEGELPYPVPCTPWVLD